MAYVVKQQVFSGRSVRPSNLERTLESVSKKARRPIHPDLPKYTNISDIYPVKLSGGHLDIVYSNTDSWFNYNDDDVYGDFDRSYAHSKPVAGYVPKRNAYRVLDLNYLNSNDYTTYYDVDTTPPDYVDFDNWFNFSPEDED